jgi:hypothetical protein
MDTGPFAIVMLPPSEEGHGVALVGLKSDGSVDSGRNFLLRIVRREKRRNHTRSH